MHLLTCLLIFTCLYNIVTPVRQSFRNPANDYQFPHQVYLEIMPRLKDAVAFNCNGAILTPLWILTAARCFYGDDVTYTVIAGCSDIKDENCTTQNVNVVKFIPYPNHTGHGDDGPNDIALLKLEKELIINKGVQPVSLPSSCSFLSNLATVAGWGGVARWWPHSVKRLRYAVVPILEAIDCQKRKMVDYIHHFDSTMMCTDRLVRYETPCKGDEGSPLTQDNIVFGVTSYVSANCTFYLQRAPTYTSVCFFTGWIHETILSNTPSKEAEKISQDVKTREEEATTPGVQTEEATTPKTLDKTTVKSETKETFENDDSQDN